MQWYWLAEYLPKFIELINAQESDYLFKNAHLATYHFMNNDYEMAYEYGL